MPHFAFWQEGRDDTVKKYVIRRLLSMFIILIAAAFVIFTILYFTPGDPARYQLGGTASEAEIAALHEKLGLNRPYLVQLWDFLVSIFRLDFGTSWEFGVPVVSELAVRLPRTLMIGGVAMLLNVALGIILGIFAGVHEGKWQDSVTMGITMIFISCPSFWVALMMIILFSAKLHWLPPYGIGGVQYYIMPIIASALSGIAINARQTRSSILEVFRADFITTARAKGQTEHKVITRHMLPNALMPIITNLGTVLTNVVTGSPVIEAIFSIPGIGMYLLVAVNNRDYPVIRASVLILALWTAIVMLAVDIAYAYLDPRIKAQYESGKKR